MIHNSEKDLRVSYLPCFSLRGNVHNFITIIAVDITTCCNVLMTLLHSKASCRSPQLLSINMAVAI